MAVATNGFVAWHQPELWIGRGHVNETESYWRGKIDDVRIFRSALGTNDLVAIDDWLGDADGDGLRNGEDYLLDPDP